MIHDVAIIGGGPCGLAVAARLREPYPSALFTDIEHARFWDRQHDNNTIEHEHRKDKKPSPSKTIKSSQSIIVFDAHSNKWMSSWKSKFELLKISHLRSPLFFHPDPQDRDGLLAFSHFENRTDELCEIENVVGREISKHKQKKQLKGKHGSCPTSARHLNLDYRDRNDYFAPSSPLFDSYIDSIVDRYNLANDIHEARIIDVSWISVEKLFSLTSSKGQVYHARTVILATGSTSLPTIPSSFESLKDAASHVFDSNTPIIPSHLKARLSSDCPARVAVVGGGLTSAQVADLLLSTYPTLKVHMIIRSKLKVKHFDVDLQWIAKLRNREMASFWSADSDEERFEMLKAAKGGGSMTPRYEKILRAWEAKHRLQFHIGIEIDTESDTTLWDGETKTWRLTLKTTAHDKAEHLVQQICTLENIDHIIFATSSAPSITSVPFLKNFHQNHPIFNVSGLPKLTQNLTWHEDIPLFVTGALAGLRLGPGAGNLAGARLGAERIAWGLEKWFDKMSPTLDDSDETNVMDAMLRRDSGYASDAGGSSHAESNIHSEKRTLWTEYKNGSGNRFQSLDLLNT